MEQDTQSSIFEHEMQEGRYMRNGVKAYNARHADRERQRELTRRSSDVAQPPRSAPRKEWWDKELLV